MWEDLQYLKDLIYEYEDLCSDLDYMADAWEGDDPCAAAESDPGLQYEKSMEIDQKVDEIKELFSKILGGNDE